MLDMPTKTTYAVFEVCVCVCVIRKTQEPTSVSVCLCAERGVSVCVSVAWRCTCWGRGASECVIQKRSSSSSGEDRTTSSRHGVAGWQVGWLSVCRTCKQTNNTSTRNEPGPTAGQPLSAREASPPPQQPDGRLNNQVEKKKQSLATGNSQTAKQYTLAGTRSAKAGQRGPTATVWIEAQQNVAGEKKGK